MAKKEQKPLIELINISRMYGFGEATTVALDNASLTINKGEFLAIMGPSGSGKSTLMNIIGLLDSPTHGSYVLNSLQVADLSQKQRSKLRLDKIGFIFQSFNLLPNLSVIENVSLPLTYAKVSLGDRLKKASKILKSLDMKEREYYMPNQLSGGQTQRTAIARALVNSPDIILADEPTGNLDSGTSANIMKILKDLHDKGNTIVMVTHSNEMADYADRIVKLQDGRIVIDQESK